MKHDDEIPGEYRDIDLLYLQETQHAKEEHFNEVSGSISNEIPKFSSKITATLHRGKPKQSKSTEAVNKAAENGCTNNK